MFDTVFLVAGSSELSLVVYSFWVLIPLLLARAPGWKAGTALVLTGTSPGVVLFRVFVGLATISAAISQDPIRSVGYLLATLVVIWLCLTLCYGLRERLGTAMRLFSILATLCLLPVYFRGTTPSLYDGRLSINEYDHPNHLGRMCFTVVAASLAWENSIIRWSLITVMAIVLTATGSRASMASAAITVLVYSLFSITQPRKRSLAVTGIISAGLLILVFNDVLVTTVASTFLAYDPIRGVGSGFAGRTAIWGAMLDVFKEHPFLGVGFRLADQFLPEQALLAGSVHNGYLSLLVEVGILGTLPLLCLVGLGLKKLCIEAVRGDPLARVGASLVIGYLAIGFFESVLLNVANPTAALFWSFTLVYAAGNRRAPRLVRLINPRRQVRERLYFLLPGQRRTPPVPQEKSTV
jgi:O-antigen ligase